MRISLLFICVSMFMSLSLSAQTIELDGKATQEPEMKVYATPKHLYLTGGSMHLGSDISGPQFSGWSAGLGYQAYFSDLQNPLFIRLGLMYGVDQGIDASVISDESYGLNQKLQDLGYEEFVRNYYASIVGLQTNVGYDVVNILTDGGAQRLGIYALAGPDIFYYTTKYDALDADGSIYDFSAINFDVDDADEQVADLLDGKYETEAPETGRLGVGFNLGIGLRYHFNAGFGLGVEHRAGFTFTDKLDGFVSDDQNDSMNHTRAFIYISLWEPSPGT